MTFELSLRQAVKDAVREALAEAGVSPAGAGGTAQGEFLRYRDAAKLVGVSPATIKRWVHEGRLPAFGVGRVRRVKACDARSCMDPAPRSAEKVDIEARAADILSSARRHR